MSVTLFPIEAVPLCAAWADRFASANGFRALMIKGSVLTDQGLRGNHTSVDVDVLVDPAVYDDYLASLRHAGWDVKIESTVAGAAERHATTVYHQAWPITIDVHRRFPGFLADPRVVFEALWQHRTEATVAHTQVTTLDPVAHAALQALHYLRSPTSGLAMLYLPDLIERTPEALGAAGLV